MPKFLVEATKTDRLKVMIEAASMEDAERIAEYELITDDFQMIGTEFMLGSVTQMDGGK